VKVVALFLVLRIPEIGYVYPVKVRVTDNIDAVKTTNLKTIKPLYFVKWIDFL